VESKLNLYQLLSPWALLFLGYLYADQANKFAVYLSLKPINQYNPFNRPLSTSTALDALDGFMQGTTNNGQQNPVRQRWYEQSKMFKLNASSAPLCAD